MASPSGTARSAFGSPWAARAVRSSGLILREGLTIVLPGLLLGFVGLVSLQHALTTVLYGVTPLDVSVLTYVTGSLLVVALIAMLIPARRAATVSPAIALME